MTVPGSCTDGEVSRYKVGWDLTAFRPRDKHVRLVEVKDASGTREKVLLTENELNKADEATEWELVIVTQALSDPQVRFCDIKAVK